MSEHNTRSDAGHGTFISYTSGLVLAVVLTLIAFGSVMLRPFSATVTFVVIIGAAVLQVIVHTSFFLHLSRSSTPRANLILFMFMLLVVSLLIGGSLWIMFAADRNMMPQMPQM